MFRWMSDVPEYTSPPTSVSELELDAGRLRVALGAVDLDGVDGRLDRRLGGLELRQCRCHRDRATSVVQGGGLVHEQAGRLVAELHLGDAVRHGLDTNRSACRTGSGVAPDRCSDRASVPSHRVERRRGRPARPRRRTRRPRHRSRWRRAPRSRPRHIRRSGCGERTAVQTALRLDRPDREPGRVDRDEEGGDAPPSQGGVGGGEHDHDVGDRRQRDPGLHAVQLQPPVVEPASGRRDGGDVRSCVRFGHGERADCIAAAQARQPACLLCRRAGLDQRRLHGEDLRCEREHESGIGRAEPETFEGEQRLDRRYVGTTECGRGSQPEHAELGGPLPAVAVEPVRARAGMFPRPFGGRGLARVSEVEHRLHRACSVERGLHAPVRIPPLSTDVRVSRFDQRVTTVRPTHSRVVVDPDPAANHPWPFDPYRPPCLAIPWSGNPYCSLHRRAGRMRDAGEISGVESVATNLSSLLSDAASADAAAEALIGLTERYTWRDYERASAVRRRSI